MKRTRNDTRQSVSYHRRTYREEAKPRKLKRLATNVCGKLYPEKNSPQTWSPPTEPAKQKKNNQTANLQYKRQNSHEAHPKSYSAIRFESPPDIQRTGKTEKAKKTRSKCLREALPLKQTPLKHGGPDRNR